MARSRPVSMTSTSSWTSMRPPATSGRTAVPARWSRKGSSTSAASSRASRAGRSTPRTGLHERPRARASRGALRRREPATSTSTVSRHSARPGAGRSRRRSSVRRPRRQRVTRGRPSIPSRRSTRSAPRSRHPVSSRLLDRRSRVAASQRRRPVPFPRSHYRRRGRPQPRDGLADWSGAARFAPPTRPERRRRRVVVSRG